MKNKPAKKIIRGRAAADKILKERNKRLGKKEENKKTGGGMRGEGRGLGSGKGKLRAIATPEDLWELFEEYQIWSKNTPYKVHTHTNAKGVKQYQDKERVLTYIGFEGWLCMTNIVYDLTHYEDVPSTIDKKAADYRTTIKKIKLVCSNDTITGASAGVFNANIAARLEGLKERVDNTSDDAPIKAPPINIYNNAPPLAGSESDVDK